MNRATVLLSFLMLIAYCVSAQSRKEIKDNGLKSKIVWKYEYKVDKELKHKESEEKFDTKGNIVEEIEYDEYGKRDKKTKYTYNENNDVVKEVVYASNGKIKKTTKYKYQGKLKVEKQVFDENDKLKSKKVYQYIK